MLLSLTHSTIMSPLSVLNSIGRAQDTAVKEADMACAFMLLVFQWELGAAGIPSRTSLNDK